MRVDAPHPLSARIFLRPIGPEDMDVLEAWENDPEVWAATDFSTWAADERPPYSRETLAQFIDSQQLGIDRTGQLRLVICLRDDDGGTAASRQANAEMSLCRRIQSGEGIADARPSDHKYLRDDVSDGSPRPSASRPLGFVDLFDYDPRARTAEVGMLIYRTADRGRGYGTQALTLACDHAFGELRIRELRCATATKNFASRRIFEKCGFIFASQDAVLLGKLQAR